MAKKQASRRSKQPEGPPQVDDKPPLKQFHLVLFQSGDDGPFGTISRSLVREISDEFEVILSQSHGQKVNVDVWLHSPGGDAHAAYKLFLALRENCERLRVVIPDYAKSAATLFALGCDEIMMARAAELGPLDVQIEHPDREGVTLSGLNVVNAIQFLADFSVDFAIGGGADVLRWTQLPRSDVLREMLGFVSKFVEPAVSKLDPNLIHRAKNQLRVAQDYAGRMLSHRKVENMYRVSYSQALQLTKRLVEQYPAHEFVISRVEARLFGLPITHAEKHSRWQNVRQKYKEFHEELRTSMIQGSSCDSLVEWIDDEILDNSNVDSEEQTTSEKFNDSSDC